MLIEQAMQLHQAGKLEQAAALYDLAIEKESTNVKVLYLRGTVAIDLEDYQKAVDLLSMAIAVNFRAHVLHDSLGTALWGLGSLSLALERYECALKLAPNFINSRYNMGCLLLDLDEESKAILELQEVIKIAPAFYQAYGKLSKVHRNRKESFCEQYYLRLFNYYMPDNLEIHSVDDQDLFFVNTKLAQKIAGKNNHIKQTVYVSARQICYCSGKPLDNPPDNLIVVPAHELVTFFRNTRFRMPFAVEFDPSDPEETKAGLMLASLLDSVAHYRWVMVNQFVKINKNLKPEFKPGEPLRVFLFASRKTVVMQYSSRNIAESLSRKGCSVKLLIEEDDRESVNLYQILQEHNNFNPHVVVNINYRNNTWLHQDVYNIIWWQDIMQELLDGKPVHWRDRDIVMTADPVLIPNLEKCGAKEVLRQSFCVNSQIFQNLTPWQERKKAIFIGASYTHLLTSDASEVEAVQAVLDVVRRGELLTMDFLRHIAVRTGLPLHHVYDMGPVFTHAVRETSVEWLCQLAPQLDLEVEVYGRTWELNPIVSPYFKGEVSHGPDVAKLYNEARYALSASPYIIDSQRLSEISACGAIPVMYDARPFALKPHWDDECLWFHSQEMFNSCFERKPPNDPAIIAKTNSYDAFAERIISIATS